MSLRDHSDVLLSDLPLFKDIKEALILQKQQQQHQNKQTRLDYSNRNQLQSIRKSTQSSNLGNSGMNYIPPLSAYNANEEIPYYPSTRGASAGRFDELSMRVEQVQQKLKSIRTLGWSFLKPIGIDDSMECLKEKTMNLRQRIPDEPTPISDNLRTQISHSLVLPGAFQENGSTDNIDLLESGMEQELGPDEMEQEEDDEASYDYDAEFARVEDEQEDEGYEEEPHVVNSLVNRGMVRDLTIQQFVETSHIDRNPYELNDEYENSHLDVDADNGDSGNFTEIPWLDVSDTVQSVETPRISSINSFVDRRTGPTRTVRRNRRISDNNSDHGDN